jgi:hypothetical protein
LIAAPVVWWFAIGNKRSPHMLRGGIAGAGAALVGQLVPHLPMVLSILSNRATADGEDQAAATISVIIYGMIGFWALLIGGVLGLVVLIMRRHFERRTVEDAAGRRTANGGHDWAA